jgi:hypothetical protein
MKSLGEGMRGCVEGEGDYRKTYTGYCHTSGTSVLKWSVKRLETALN